MSSLISDSLNRIRDAVRTRFEQSRRVLSFEEYLELVQLKPYNHLRAAAQYTLDGIHHFGSYEKAIRGHNVKRYKIFDSLQTEAPRPIIGQEAIQESLVQILTGFTRAGKADKLVVLHGPNGSAKSSMARALFEGIETYSHSEEGALFTFSWIFPVGTPDRSGLGFAAGATSTGTAGESFAKLDQEKIGAIVRSELHESPLFLLPEEERAQMFEQWLAAAKTPSEREKLLATKNTFFRTSLNHKNSIIFEALLNDYRGDFKKVLRHIRVERFFLSRRLRSGLVTIEPQFSVDAALRQVTMDRSLASLPAALQSLNLFQLEGDLVDGNRGMVEFNDLLKRPPEHFKYLLGTCETGSITLGSVMAFLDTVFIASTNDRQLDAFREHPDFNSFKARMEFIRVPYLLRYSDEEKIYLETAKSSAGGKELMPHTTRVLALWAVLTRLKRPVTKNKPAIIAKILENLSPLAKAKLYDSAELPGNISDEERRELRNHIEALVQEQEAQPYYEGLMGASARELKVLLQIAAQNDHFPTLGPAAIFYELEKLVQRPMDFEYLRIEPNQGYHDYEGLIQSVRQEWMNWVDREMLDCLNLQRDVQIRDFLGRYMQHVTHFVRNEKMRNRVTGQAEQPDETLMQEFETSAGVSGDATEFRKDLISRLGAWSLEHPGRDVAKALPFEEIFTDLIRKLQESFREQDHAKIKLMGASMLDGNVFGEALATANPSTLAEGPAMAVKAYRGLQERYGYGPEGAKEALVSLVRDRYL